ncbi:MAG: gamma-glutamylcyclotransferase family protein [Mucilaginibacter sp.]
MKKTSPYLFVYGTLLDKHNEFGAYLNANCTFYADGRFKGKLYDIGEYPGAIAAINGNNYVHGKIYRLNNAEQVFKQLDYYEGFGPEEAQPNLFTRALLTIEVGTETVECWVYLYNLPVAGLTLIESGIYLRK